MNELEEYLPESGIIYTKYHLRINLLDFLIESFKQEDFREYKDIIDWFFEHTGNNPGFFSLIQEEKTEENELFTKLKLDTLVF